MASDQSRNKLQKRSDDLTKARLAETMLLTGTTVKALSAALGCSTRNARRILDCLRSQGCEITSNFTLGTQDASVFKMTKNSRLFRR